MEQVIRNFPEVAEYRITAQREGALDRLKVEVEDHQQSPDRIAAELQLRLGLKIEVAAVPIGTLPRFEGKAERFFDRRKMGMQCMLNEVLRICTQKVQVYFFCDYYD